MAVTLIINVTAISSNITITYYVRYLLVGIDIRNSYTVIYFCKLKRSIVDSYMTLY